MAASDGIIELAAAAWRNWYGAKIKQREISTAISALEAYRRAGINSGGSRHQAANSAAWRHRRRQRGVWRASGGAASQLNGVK